MPSFLLPVQVRFRDIDALGHVNNAVFLTYMEVARVAFARDVLHTARIEDIDFLVARIEIDYRRPVLLDDDLSCAMHVERLGRTSFVIAYVFTVRGEVVAEGRSVQVFIDRASGRTKPVPPAFVDAVSPFGAPS